MGVPFQDKDHGNDGSFAMIFFCAPGTKKTPQRGMTAGVAGSIGRFQGILPMTGCYLSSFSRASHSSRSEKAPLVSKALSASCLADSFFFSLS